MASGEIYMNLNEISRQARDDSCVNKCEYLLLVYCFLTCEVSWCLIENMTLSKSDLQEIKNLVNDVVIDASEAILKGVQSMFDDQNKQINSRFKLVDDQLSKLEVEQRHLKHDFGDIKAEFSTSVSIGQFNSLKAKVNLHHPTS